MNGLYHKTFQYSFTSSFFHLFWFKFNIHRGQDNFLELEMKLVRKWHHQFWNFYKGHDLSISLLGSIGEPWFSTGIVKTFITLISNFCTTSILGAIYSLYKVLPLLVTILAVNPMMPNQWNKISTKNSINQLEQAASCSFKPKSICLSNPKLKNKQKMNNVFANWNLIKKTKGISPWQGWAPALTLIQLTK